MVEKMAHRPKEVQEALGIGNTKFYQLVKEGKLDTRKIGKVTIVTNLRAFVDGLPKAGASK